MTTSPGMVALLDQVDAASRQVSTRLRAAADANGLPLTPVDEWARGIVDDLLGRAATGRLRACPHLTSPQPLVTAAWRRDVIACWPCARVLFDLSSDPVADATCDQCHRYVARIVPSLVACGPVMILNGRCKRCRAAGGQQ
jgi:hypothetical protein